MMIFASRAQLFILLGTVSCLFVCLCSGDATANTKTCTAAAESMKEPSTGSLFPASLSSRSNLEVIGVGVRRKGPIKVYSVGLYASNQLKKTLSALSGTKEKAKAVNTLRSAADVSFLLQMNWKVGAEKMVRIDTQI